ncbi:O-antigen ligase family protein [Subtercola sp. RTI3]|uniref:O-antigen ligase family protein n=1 Tax=Subtercola sp. RTI3 TaxID=3048639 RepID=UPI002B236803|nr:O-antigen ligase family protein [Subtercola sp. RTI3]MEA9984408.1 O-antigen ligase family protein [Subtercola sp. RTI3]
MSLTPTPAPLPPFDSVQHRRATMTAPDGSPAGRIRLAGFVLFTALGGDAWQSLFGWPAFVVLVVGLTVACAVSLAQSGRRIALPRYSKPLVAFVVLCAVSLLWSQYPGATALGIAAQWLAALAGFFMALTLTWLEILRALGTALRWMLGLSLLFELAVAVWVRQPLPALWLLAPGQTPPADYQWSTASLLNGGPIQGIVGNRNLLAFLVLLALIVFAIEWVEKTRSTFSSIAWLAVAVLEHALTRSATVLMATVAVAFVLAIALAIRRVAVNRRLVIYPFGIAGLVGLAFAIPHLSDRLFPLLGRSNDLTGRFDIWNTVLSLAWQHPVLGWGWVSYWAPWVAPFKGLIVIDGTEYLQAHNAWVDIFLQLGFVGLFVFGCLIAATGVRSWWMAVDPPGPLVGVPTPYQAIALLPLLLLAALVIQSLTESRLLLEGNFLLLVLLATKVKLDPLPLGPPPRSLAR